MPTRRKYSAAERKLIASGKSEQVKARRTQQPGRDLNAFSDLHDRSTIIPRKIRDGLKSLGQRWMYAHEFAKHCGVSKEQLGQYGEQFADHWTDLRADRKRVWAGSAAFLEQLKARVQ